MIAINGPKTTSADTNHRTRVEENSRPSTGPLVNAGASRAKMSEPFRDIAEIKTLSKPTRLEQQQVVLKLFGYRLCDAAAKAELEQKAQRVARLSTLA
jgi:hypothetical protein